MSINIKELETEFEKLNDDMPWEYTDKVTYKESLDYINKQIIRNSKYIYNIRQTLDRINNNEFGKCKSCGKRIDKERLLTLPTTLYCFKCAK